MDGNRTPESPCVGEVRLPSWDSFQFCQQNPLKPARSSSIRAARVRSCEIIEQACRLEIAFGSPGSAGVAPANHVDCHKYGYARETRALPGRSIRCQRRSFFHSFSASGQSSRVSKRTVFTPQQADRELVIGLHCPPLTVAALIVGLRGWFCGLEGGHGGLLVVVNLKDGVQPGHFHDGAHALRQVA